MLQVTAYVAFFMYASFITSLTLLGRVRQKNLLALGIILPLVFFLGLRGNVSSDYISYINIFGAVPEISDVSLAALDNVYGEYGFLLLVSLIKSIANVSSLMFTIIALISLLAKLSFIKFFSENVLAILMVYLSFYLILYEVIQIRWGLAFGIGLYAMVFFQSQKYFRFILLSFFATSVHLYALIFIIFPLLAKCLSLRCLFVILLLSVFFGLSFNVTEIIINLVFFTNSDGYVAGKLVNYSQNANAISRVLLLKVLMINLLFMIGSAMGNKKVRQYLEIERYSFILRLSLVFTSYLFLVSGFGVLSGRILPVVDLLAIILLFDFCSRFFTARDFSLLLSFIIICSIFVFLYVVSLAYANGNLSDYYFASFGG